MDVDHGVQFVIMDLMKAMQKSLVKSLDYPRKNLHINDCLHSAYVGLYS